MSIATGCRCWSRNILSFSWFSSVTPHTARNWLFFHKRFQAQLRDYFHGPVCPAQRMICHLTQTPITGPTPGSCDYGSEGPASPASKGSPPVTRLRHSRPLQIRDNQPCQREGWASCIKHRHDRLLSLSKLGGQGSKAGYIESWAERCQN